MSEHCPVPLPPLKALGVRKLCGPIGHHGSKECLKPSNSVSFVVSSDTAGRSIMWHTEIMKGGAGSSAEQVGGRVLHDECG